MAHFATIKRFYSDAPVEQQNLLVNLEAKKIYFVQQDDYEPPSVNIDKQYIEVDNNNRTVIEQEQFNQYEWIAFSRLKWEDFLAVVRSSENLRI